MELFVLRHGEAGKRLPVRTRDTERSLTAEGKDEVDEVARAMSRLKIKPDQIISSPLKRSRETAAMVARALKKRDKVEIWDELKPEGSRQALYNRLSAFKVESSAVIVGHEPYLTQMINEVMSHQGAPKIVLKKGGLARLSIRSFNPKVEGELRWLLTPRLLKRIS
jgi:phosphohistidine phosphatase